MKKLNLFFILFFLSCSALPKRPYTIQANSLYQNYPHAYDAVWSATLKALSKYPIVLSNKDAGTLKTDFIKEHSRTEFYYSGGVKLPKENKWKLDLRLLSLSGNHLVRVKIEKEEYTNPGFLEEWRYSPSDLLTEKAILYRIERIILLDEKIEK